ncbi:transporter substrate-binding domain-containing protein [Aeromonas bestiarum]|nr:transporter substrate-binding domain-containing protein [Aeromonas bestiarum]
MKWTLLPWLLLGSLTLSAQPALTLLSHELPPFTQSRDGQLGGLAVRLVREAQQEMGVNYPIKIYPLKRALALTRVEPGFAMFVVLRTPQREAQFKWVGPLFLNRVLIYQARGSQPLTDLAQLRQLERVGVLLGSADDERLTHEGYANLVLGKIDAFPMGDLIMSATLDQMGFSPRSVVSSEVLLHESWLYIAFSKSEDDAVIARWQAAIDKVKARYGQAQPPAQP